MSNPEEFPDEAIESFLDAEIYPDIPNNILLDYEEDREEENSRLERIIPLLETFRLVPEGLDTRSLDIDVLETYAFGADAKLGDFAYRTFRLSKALHAVDMMREETDTPKRDDYLTEDIEEALADIIADNKHWKDWLHVARLVLGEKFPLSDNKEILHHQVVMLRGIRQNRIEQFDLRMETKDYITEQLAKKVGMHDDIKSVAGIIISRAATFRLTPVDSQTYEDGLVAHVNQMTSLEIDRDQLIELLYEAIKSVFSPTYPGIA